MATRIVKKPLTVKAWQFRGSLIPAWVVSQHTRLRVKYDLKSDRYDLVQMNIDYDEEVRMIDYNDWVVLDEGAVHFYSVSEFNKRFDIDPPTLEDDDDIGNI